MRRIHIGKGDFALFHQDINPIEYEFFRNHSGAFKRMWNEQTRSFWIVFVDMFDHFIWNYGVMKDFPLKIDEVHRYVEEIISLITLSFIEGNASSAKTLITECSTVAQNRHYIGTLDKASYAQNPFYIKDTREAFRKLFGMPRSKTTFMKVLCGLPVYVKFAGSIVTLLRRWLSADNLEDPSGIDAYLSQLTSIRANDKASLEAIERALAREKRREETEKTTKKVSKKHFAHEGTKQKALEWIDDSKTSSSIAGELEELDPLPSERRSYKSEYKKAIQSVTEDVRNSLVESIAEVKRKEIELAREKGEDVDHIIEEFKEDLAKRKRPRRKKGRKRGGAETGDDEISSLMALHKEVSSSDRYLEAIGAKRPQGSLLPPCITEVNDTDDENDPIAKEKVIATANSSTAGTKEGDDKESENNVKTLESCKENSQSPSEEMNIQLPVEEQCNQSHAIKEEQSNTDQVPVEGGSIPPVEGESIPPVEGESIPPVEGESIPPVEGESTPPVEGESIPPVEGESIPPVEGESIPPVEGGKLPSVEEENVQLTPTEEDKVQSPSIEEERVQLPSAEDNKVQLPSVEGVQLPPVEDKVQSPSVEGIQLPSVERVQLPSVKDPSVEEKQYSSDHPSVVEPSVKGSPSIAVSVPVGESDQSLVADNESRPSSIESLETEEKDSSHQITVEEDSTLLKRQSNSLSPQLTDNSPTIEEPVSPDDCYNNDTKRKLHICSYCQKKEEVAKTFKRCVKCRGKPRPHYYCSKSCQVNEWKAGHRLAHKDD